VTDVHINHSIPLTALISMLFIIGATWYSQHESIDLSTLPPAERGERIYRRLCLSCHAADPTKEREGVATPGPPLAGSSLTLLTMRVRSLSYPEGYTPKRNTQNMTTFDLSDEVLADLFAFLNPSAAPPAGKGAPDKAGTTGTDK
jgi:mono/diheme cytochrome c family protein